MLHPYQCLYYCQQASHSETGILVGASGYYIHTFSAQNGRYLSTWPTLGKHAQCRSVGEKNKIDSEVLDRNIAPQDDSERPSKRQKMSLARDESGSSSAEIVVAGDSDDDEWSSPEQPPRTPIIKLAGTSNGQHVVATTGEDKCIRVFNLAADGTLTLLSERSMPKRPSAVVLTPDNSTILCADKFGDVYSLPLFGQAYQPKAVDSAHTNGTEKQKQKQKPFIPSATSLTVHTKRNRDALWQQQKSKNLREEKKSLNFDHKLLLGHVSLLTDVMCVNLVSPLHKPRNYILTADRDEHIRVSRGIPHAHMIDGYCLGHTEFITKLCVPPAYDHLLISGGGDDYLMLWDWPAGKMLQRFDLRGLVDTFRNTHFEAGKLVNSSSEDKDAETNIDSALKICVSNIQALETFKEPSGHSRIEIIITCEGVPALFIFTLEEKGELEFHTNISTESNVIDLTILRNQNSVVYSMDTSHQVSSTDVPADSGTSTSERLMGSLSYCMDSKIWKVNESLQANLERAMKECADANLNVSQTRAAKEKPITELIYSLESLRKRGSDSNETDV